MLVSTTTGNASIILPSDFAKPAANPLITWDGSTTEEFLETIPQKARQYSEAAKRVSYFGNKKDGFVMRVYGVTLVSGASVMIPYYKSATSLASPSDVSEIPEPQYLVKRSLAYMLEAREDPRYVGMKAEANQILGNMIDRDDSVAIGSDENTVKTAEQAKSGGYRIGGW